MKARQCPRCLANNSGVAEFCQLCGKPFNEAMIVEEILEAQTLRGQIDDLKERSEVADDVVDSMWKVIDKLKKEVETLKAK